MTTLITLTIAGADTGPYSLYSDVDGFIIPFETGVTKAALLAGYVSSLVPDGAVTVRIMSNNLSCSNYIDVSVIYPICFAFLPDTSYILDYVYTTTSTYAYGNFTEYKNSYPILSASKIIKLNSDLTRDESFVYGTGFNTNIYVGNSIIEQPDGKIIATGDFTSYDGVAKNRIVRLNTDGSIDSTFSIGTGFSNITQGAQIDSLGRIIVTGYFGSYNGNTASRIARILPNGTFDSTFVMGSGFNNTGVDVLVNPDDSIFVVGYFNSYNGTAISPDIVKLLPNGSIDTSFNGGTGFFPAGANQVAMLTRIPGETSFIVVGYFTSYNGTSANHIIKLNMNGTVDGSFLSTTGFNDIVSTVYVVWDNKICIKGDFTSYNGTTSYYTIILNADGSIYYTYDIEAYHESVIIGDTLYIEYTGGCLTPVHTYVPPITTTTTTVAPTTTTTTSTAALTTTTTTTLAPEMFSFAFSGVDGPDACVEFSLGNDIIYYASPGTVISNGLTLYTDPELTIIAPDGYYSSGTDYYDILTSDGVLQGETICPAITTTTTTTVAITTTTTTAAPTTTTTTTAAAPGALVCTYLIEGVWDVDDPAHPAGGFINYVNASGDPANESGLWVTDSFNISARDIGSHSGVSITLIDCNSINLMLSNSTPALPCGSPSIPSTFPISVYSMVEFLAIGDIVYNNETLTTPFNGDGTYYWRTSFFGYAINGSGVVTAVIDCA